MITSYGGMNTIFSYLLPIQILKCQALNIFMYKLGVVRCLFKISTFNIVGFTLHSRKMPNDCIYQLSNNGLRISSNTFFDFSKQKTVLIKAHLYAFSDMNIPIIVTKIENVRRNFSDDFCF